MRKPVGVLTILLLSLASCDSAPGPEPTGTAPPVLSDFSLRPQRLVYALLPPQQIVGDSVAVPLEIAVTVSGPGTSVGEVRYVVQSPQSLLEPIHSGSLKAEGSNRYSASLTLMISALEVRTYTIVVYAVGRAGRIGGEIRARLEYVRSFEPGSPPMIDELLVPDTVQRPVLGQPAKTLLLAADVSDPDGLPEVEKVEFWNVETPGSRFLLCDDGPQRACGASHESGDEVGGDGRFTRLVFVESTNATGVTTLHFQATDRAGLQSEAKEKSIVIVK